MYIGAFDIGGTKTIIALADEAGMILHKEQFVTDTRDCRKHLDVCCDIFRGFLEKEGIGPEEVAGIGVSLPGIVDRREGILLRAVYAGCYNVPAQAYLAEAHGIVQG